MLILAVTLPIKPDHREEAVEIALQMVAETHKEEGCVAYPFHVGAKKSWAAPDAILDL